MTSPIDFENKAPGPIATKLPALGSPELSTQYLSKIKEIIEGLLGRRGGSNWDRVVTFRDLADLGVEGNGALAAVDGQPAQVLPAPGSPGSGALDNAILHSAAYQALLRRIGSVEDLAGFPDEIRNQLTAALTDLARERQADIRTILQKQQTAALSYASQINELTASLARSSAGVRQFSAAYADDMQAVALQLTQLSAAIDGVGNINVEERLQAIVDAVTGLQGQWSVKIQGLDADGNPIIAGIGLSVEAPTEGPSTSALIFMAENFGFLTHNGTQIPFSISADGRIQFNGDVYIDGRLMLGANGIDYSNVIGRPQDISSLVRKSSFDDGVMAPWNANGVSTLDGFSYEKVPFTKQLITNARDTEEVGNAFAITPGETLYFGCWVNTDDTPYTSGFGVAVRDRTGTTITWVNATPLAGHRAWAYIEGSWTVPEAVLDAQGVAHVPASATPWLQQDGFDFTVHAYARFAGMWIGRHARGATVGAPAGTQVAGTAAETLVANASNALTNAANALQAAGDASYAAGLAAQAASNAALIAGQAQSAANGAADQIPGLTQAIAAKLNKDGADTIHGQIGLASQYALLVGTPDNGVWIGSGGIFMVQNGQVKASMPLSGAPTFAGRLIAAFGTFGSVAIAAGGALTVMAANYGDEGIFLGFVGTVPKFSIVAGGVKLLYDPSAAQPLQLINARLANSTLDEFSGSIGGIAGGSYPNPSPAGTLIGFGSLTANSVGGKLPISYLWTITPAGRTATNAYMRMDSTTSKSVGLTGTGSNIQLDYYVSCVMTDASNRTVTLSTEVTAAMGTPA